MSFVIFSVFRFEEALLSLLCRLDLFFLPSLTLIGEGAPGVFKSEVNVPLISRFLSGSF